MKQKGIPYTFTTLLWAYGGNGGWHFVSLPINYATEIRGLLKSEEAGWGRLKATAAIGATTWKTAIWFDTKLNTYLLPVKAAIRSKEHITSGQTITINIWV